MKDSAAWRELGDQLKGAGYVPGGLCFALDNFLWGGAISVGQKIRMVKQLYTYRTRLQRPGDHSFTGHFWPYSQLAPRIRACYWLAERLAREGR